PLVHTQALQERMTALPRNTRFPRSNIVFAFALALACYLAWLLRVELMILYVSALFAVVLLPVVHAIESFHFRNWRPNKVWAVFVMLVAIAAFLTVFGLLAIPP